MCNLCSGRRKVAEFEGNEFPFEKRREILQGPEIWVHKNGQNSGRVSQF